MFEVFFGPYWSRSNL